MLAGGWALWKRTSPARLFVQSASLNAAVVLILAEKAIRALRGGSWQAGEDFAQAVSLTLVFYLALNLLPAGRGLAIGLVFASACWSVIGMLVAYQRGYAELAMPLGNRVLMAGLLIPVAPLAAGLWSLGQQRPLEKSSILLLGCVLVLSIIHTRSATAIVILAVMCLIAAAVELTRRDAVIVTLSLVASSLIFVVFMGGFEPIERLKGVILHGEDPTLSWNNRVRYWTGAIPAVRSQPVFGYGPGQVGLVYPRYRIQQPVLAPHGEVVPDLHSLPLNWLFEFGFIGLAVRFFLCIGFIASVLARGDRLQRSAAFGLAGYGVFSMIHYQLETPAIFSAVWCTAIVAAPRVHVVQLSRGQATVWGGLLACAAAAIFSFQCGRDYSSYLMARSYSENASQAAASAIQAAVLDARGGFYDFAAALRIRAALERISKANPESDYLFAAADRHYSASLKHAPLMPQVLASYGAFLLSNARPAAAVQPLQKAVSLDFYFSLSHFDLANAYRSCAQEEMSVREAAAAILVHPTLAYATHWRRDSRFLNAAIKRSLDWLSSWDPPAGSQERAKLEGLNDFLQTRLGEPPQQVARIVPLVFSDSVGGQLIDDPFAFIYHRASPYFEMTQIELDGLASGSWSPVGIGSFRWLRALTYDIVNSAYERQGLDSLMVSIGKR